MRARCAASKISTEALFYNKMPPMKLRNTGSFWSFMFKSSICKAICMAAFCQSSQAQTTAIWDGSIGNWTDATRWSTDPVFPNNAFSFGDTYAVTVSGGNVARDTSLNISELTLSGGEISGFSFLEVQGPMSWTGGTISTGSVSCTGGLSMNGNVTLANNAELWLSGAPSSLGGGNIDGTGTIRAFFGDVDIAGNVGATTGPATGGFSMQGGTISGSGTLSVERGEISSGSMMGTSTLRFTGQSTVSSSAFSMEGGIIQNDGEVNQNGSFNLDNSSLDGGGAIQNNGIWNLNSAGIFNVYGEGIINNTGSIKGNGNLFAMTHNAATGNIEVVGGVLSLSGGGSQAGVLNANGGPIFMQNGNWNFSGGSLTGSNSCIASFLCNINLTGDVGANSGPATGGFDLDGGEISGNGTLSAERGNLSSGSITGTPTLRFTGQSTVTSGFLGVNMTSGVIQNDGEFNQAGNLNLDSSPLSAGGTIQNHGTWNLTNGTISNEYGGGSINNTGSIKGSGNISAMIHNAATGNIEVVGGVLSLSGGGSQAGVLNANGGPIFMQNGNWNFSGGSLAGINSCIASFLCNIDLTGDVGASSGPATGGFSMQGGTISGSGTLSLERGELSSGSMMGTPTLRFTGQSTVSSSGFSMEGGTIQNDGGFIQTGNLNLDSSPLSGGGTIQNYGTWDLANGSIDNSNGGGIVNNAGSFSGSGSVRAAFNNQGTGSIRTVNGSILLEGGGGQAGVMNADNANIDIFGGNWIFSGGSLIGSGFTQLYGHSFIDLTGNVGVITGPATGGFSMQGGTISGTGTLSAERGNLSGGTITGTPTLRFTGESMISSLGFPGFRMQSGTIQNDGVFNQAGSLNLDSSPFIGGGTIQNHGTWNLAYGSIDNSNGDGIINNSGSFSGSGSVRTTFHNQATGSIRTVNGSILLEGGGSQAGVMNADNANIDIFGGDWIFSGGSLTGNGSTQLFGSSIELTGNVGVNTGPATGGFSMQGGTISGTGTLSAERGNLSGGLITGAPTLRFTGQSTLNAFWFPGFRMQNGTIQNDGVFNQAGILNLDSSSFSGGGTIQNNGTWNLTNSNIDNINGGGRINNSGILTSSNGISQINAEITNSGVINCALGSSLFLNGSTSHTGTLNCAGDVLLGFGSHTISGPNAILTGRGRLSGNVTITDGAKLVTPNPGYLYLHILSGTVNFTAGATSPAVKAFLYGVTDNIFLSNNAAIHLGNEITDLEVVLESAPQPGNVFEVIKSNHPNGVTGRFRNLPATGSILNASFQGNNYELRASYLDSGMGVYLTVIRPYSEWATSRGLAGAEADFSSDPDLDRIPNGIEFLMGSEPNPTNPNSISASMRPQISSDANYLSFVYRRRDEASQLINTVEYSSSLTGDWSIAQDSVNGIIIEEMDNAFGLGTDRVEVKIPIGLAVDGRLFARLKVAQPQP
jgi:hypothetical protein